MILSLLHRYPIMNKCMAGDGLLAQVLVDKYVDHLPLHRQLQRFERTSVTIAQSTINDWVKAVLNHVAVLYNAHEQVVQACGYLPSVAEFYLARCQRVNCEQLKLTLI